MTRMASATLLATPILVARTWMMNGSPRLQTRMRDRSVRPSDRSSERVSSSRRVSCRRPDAPTARLVSGTGGRTDRVTESPEYQK